MKCIFCYKKLSEAEILAHSLGQHHFACPYCRTVQEKELVDRPFRYSVGDRNNYQAPHVKADWRDY